MTEKIQARAGLLQLIERLEDAASAALTQAANAGRVAHKAGIYMPAIETNAELAQAIIALRDFATTPVDPSPAEGDALLRQALEALEPMAKACSGCQEGPEDGPYCCRKKQWDAVIALRTALKSKPEPKHIGVAVSKRGEQFEYDATDEAVNCQDCGGTGIDGDVDDSGKTIDVPCHCTKASTTQAPAVKAALTDEQAHLLYLKLSEKMATDDELNNPYAMFLDILRDIERAHGIGEAQPPVQPLGGDHD